MWFAYHIDVSVPAHSAIELAAAELFEGFFDLSYAYLDPRIRYS